MLVRPITSRGWIEDWGAGGHRVVTNDGSRRAGGAREALIQKGDT